MKSFHSKFTFLDWQLNSENFQLSLNYEIENVGLVTEVLTFPKFDKDTTSLEIIAACDLIHLLCGVSYYKAGLAKEIVFKNNQPSQGMAKFIQKTWKHGLAELAFENNISLKNHININGASINALTPLMNSNNPTKSLVALGGGKDSLVSIEELKEQGKDINLFMVGNSALIKEVADFIDLPLIQVHRKIDPKLIAYNKTGKGFNGHVPITSIISAIAVLTALLFDCDEVVFSNEKSADSANTINADGEEVNHQYSKSHEFEKDLSEILSSEVTGSVRYYSQQRKFSELEILEKFAKYPQYFPIFSSCNQNFHIDGSHNKDSKWCCDCPKCRFVFLGLAPFISKQQLLKIFKHNLLDDKSQEKGFAELLGTVGFKPFECVGEIQESQQAYKMIRDKAEWKNDVLVKSNFLTPLHSSLKQSIIAIWGFGVEGKATAEYLSTKHIDFKVLCSEKEADNQYKCITDEVDVGLLNSFDVVIKSPGISPYSDLVKNASCEFISPTAIWFANEKQTKVIAVTGTKGKSTIASLLAHVLNECGYNVNLVGNIGKPLITSSSDYDYIVLESSSFQIFDGNISADIALVNNLFAEHLDWHDGKENYFNDKLKILNNAQIKIVNANNQTINELINSKDFKYFNSKKGFHIIDESLLYCNVKILKLDEISLIGKHNLENCGAVLTICQQLILSIKECVKAIRSFKPLAHRLQDLGKIGQHFAINDSIATTPIATLAAMQTFDLQKTTLLVGGFDRGHDWSEFAQALNDNPVNSLILCGPSGQLIYDYLQVMNSKINFSQCDSLSKSIEFAQKYTPSGHTILLSPGAPSFDEFKSYIKRGEFFEKELKKL